MSIFEAICIFLAGIAAGTINTVVGSGALVTFPTLLAFGYPPVVATMSNAVGLVPGNISGTWGYRRFLGAHVGRKLSPGLLRVVIVILGVVALWVLLT